MFWVLIQLKISWAYCQAINSYVGRTPIYRSQKRHTYVKYSCWQIIWSWLIISGSSFAQEVCLRWYPRVWLGNSFSNHFLSSFCIFSFSASLLHYSFLCFLFSFSSNISICCAELMCFICLSLICSFWFLEGVFSSVIYPYPICHSIAK